MTEGEYGDSPKASSWSTRWKLTEPGKKKGGGQGTTRKVVSTDTENPVNGVLKTLKKKKDGKARTRFATECLTLRNLEELGRLDIPRILDDNTSKSNDPSVELYIVMENIEGPTLFEWVGKNGPCDLQTALDVVGSLLDALDAIHDHAASTLHRDIKPENIILRDSNPKNPVLVDFGLSHNSAAIDATTVGESFYNSFIRLPEWITPSGDKRSPLSDVTCVCALLHYLLTGELVGELLDENGKQPHRRTNIPVNKDVYEHKDMSPRVVGFLDRALQRDFRNRFQSAREATNFLKSIPGSNFGDVTLLQLDSEIGEDIKLTHLPTRLNELRKSHSSIIKNVSNVANSVTEKLENFEVNRLESVNFRDSSQEIDGFPIAQIIQPGVCCKLKSQSQGIARIYALVLNDQNGLLYTQEVFTRNARAARFTFTENWKMLYACESDSEVFINIVNQEFKQWIADAMNQLKEYVKKGSIPYEIRK